MDKLHNCPNCGGYLNDTGRCEFCGSKVYDLCDVNLALDPKEPQQKTYLRIKTDQGIWTVPVYADSLQISQPSDYIDCTLGLTSNYVSVPKYPEIELHFIAVGKGSYEKNSIDWSVNCFTDSN